MNKVSKVFDHVLDVFFFIGGALVVVVGLMICAEVAMRYFLGIVHVWEVQIGGDSLLWITFLGAALVLKEDKHVRVDIVFNNVSPRIRHALSLIISTLGLVSCLVLTYYSAQVTWDHFARGVCEHNILVIPKGPLMIIIPIGSFLFSIEFLRKILSYWKPVRAHVANKDDL